MIKKIEELFLMKKNITNLFLKQKKIKNNTYKLISNRDEQNNIFDNINTFIPKFMDNLWKNPESIATILSCAEKNDMKENLAHFIVHYFYNSCFSSLNNKEEQLIYIIAILLKNEIDALKDIKSPFLNETNCCIILQELSKKKEIIFFFKNIIIEVVKKLENTYSLTDIIFEPETINETIKDFSNNKINEISSKINKDMKVTIDNYIFINFDENTVNAKSTEYKDKKDMHEFFGKIIKDLKSLEKPLNNKIISIITDEEKSEIIFQYYKNSIFQVIDIINILFDKLIKNIDSLPYSIKCICKIISVLIKKKFPQAIKVEQNRFLINFFFQILLFPILMDPTLNSLINEVIITDLTIKKLQYIMDLLNTITFGELFVKDYKIPLNWYIIDKMPKIIEFLNSICQVELPSFIDNLINDKLPDNYKYDYFKENPNEGIFYRNIFYNIDELITLISYSEKCKNNISIHKRIISNLYKNIQQLKDIKENLMNNNEPNKKKEIKYFLLTDFYFNEKIKKILNTKKTKKKHFTLNELKEVKTYEEEIENNKIKVKNYFYSFLYNYETLSKNNFKKENLRGVINILKELKTRSSTNSSNNIDNNYIIKWYIDSLIQYLSKLPKELIDNDYEKLLNELEYEIKSSIKELNFEEICDLCEYYDNIEKEIKEYEKIKDIFNDIKLNKYTNQLINENKILIDSKSDKQFVKFFFNLMEQDKDFSNLFQVINKKNKNIYYSDINSFIDIFPNYTKHHSRAKVDDFEYIKQKNVPEIINNYFIIIKTILNNNLKNNKNAELIYDKIYDYIMEKLYDKLFPKEPLSIDNLIFQNCCKHIWVELSNLIKEDKKIILDNYLPDSIKYLNLFEIEKSPRKKLLNINKLVECIYNLNEINGGIIKGFDDELAILNFIFIKTKPELIYSNCKYTEIFLGDKKKNIEEQHLMELLAICNKMKTMSLEQLYNITDSDYDDYCELISQGLLY